MFNEIEVREAEEEIEGAVESGMECIACYGALDSLELPGAIDFTELWTVRVPVSG